MPYYNHGNAYDHNPDPNTMHFGSPPLMFALTMGTVFALAMLRALPK